MNLKCLLNSSHLYSASICWTRIVTARPEEYLMWYNLIPIFALYICITFFARIKESIPPMRITGQFITHWCLSTTEMANCWTMAHWSPFKSPAALCRTASHSKWNSFSRNDTTPKVYIIIFISSTTHWKSPWFIYPFPNFNDWLGHNKW